MLLLALLLILGACTPKQESTADTTEGIASTAGTQTAPSTGTTGTTAPAETTQPTQGYSAYQGDIRYAIGGGLMLMENGKPCFKAADESYRTCVGITEEGDLMLLCMDKAYYGMAVRVFMDLNLDVYDILNLDGGGSTTLYTQNSGVLERNICGQSPSERPVADVLAIVAGS